LWPQGQDEVCHEEDVPAEQPAAEEDPRVSGADAHQERAASAGSAAAQGAGAAFTVALPFPERLGRREDFTRTYREGVKVVGRYLVLFLRWRGGSGGARLGITATRRVGGAVVRNRCRRRVRALARGGGAWQEAPLDVVVNVRRELAEAPWQELLGDFSRCMERGLRRLGEQGQG